MLDKNEQAEDVDFAVKMKLAQALMETDWNRYPSADLSDIEAKVANYCGLDQEHIVLGPGSASIITTLLNYFALNKQRIVIAQPTYSLFDYHCKTYNIPYEPWLLTQDLEYDYTHLPALSPGSVLIVTSPNNPVGNTIDVDILEQMLTKNPQALIILDAVYTEFTDVDVTPLVRKYPNLMVLRSFSKAFPIAGLRFGYLCTNPQTAAVVRKLMLQFSLNHLTQVFAREILFSAEFQESSKQRVKAIISERKHVYRVLSRRFDPKVMRVFHSEGNFLLIRIFNDADFQKTLQSLEKNGIKVLNTSPFPLLQNTFRVSIGSSDENGAFMQCLSECLGEQALRRPMGIQLMAEAGRKSPARNVWKSLHAGYATLPAMRFTVSLSPMV